MADNNIDIPASRDGAMYNVFANGQDFIIKGIGNELAITYSGSNVTIDTGEAVICGRHVVVSEPVTVTIANGLNYVCLEIDLSKAAGNEGSIIATGDPGIPQDLNNGGVLARMELCFVRYSGSEVTQIKDRRIVVGGIPLQHAPSMGWPANMSDVNTLQEAIVRLSQRYNFYLSVEGLGSNLDTPAYISEIIQAMDEGSIALINAGEIVSTDWPSGANQYAFVVFIKRANNRMLIFWVMRNANKTYIYNEQGSAWVELAKQSAVTTVQNNLDATNSNLATTNNNVTTVNNKVTNIQTTLNGLGKTVLSVQAIAVSTSSNVNDKATATLSGTMNEVTGATEYILIAERVNFFKEVF